MKPQKNHKKNENGIVSGYIPSIDNKYCPVKASLSIHNLFILNLISFAKHPNTTGSPLMVMKYGYGPGNVSHNNLNSFTTNIAKKCGLDDKGYTNHMSLTIDYARVTKIFASNKSD